MKRICTAILLPAFASGILILSASAQEKAPLPMKLPEPTLKGTPEDLPKNPNIEPIRDKDEVFLAPKGVKNVALGKPVTSSVKPFNGELAQITDGKKEAVDGDTVEMKKGPQYVQVDLGADYAIYAIAMWHDHRYVQIIHCVVVQVSDDPEFKTGVQTVYNNDRENLCGQGVGTEREYYETHRGKLVDAKGVKGRYVRCYGKGSTTGALNCWEELEVYGLPAN